MNTVYPTCRTTFRLWCNRNNKYEKIYNKLGNPLPFDVTLRDGLQGLSKEEQQHYTGLQKISLYYDIKTKHFPLNMEIGSIVSNKVFPIFKDSDIIYNYLKYDQLEPGERKVNNFILIPNEKQFYNISKFMGLDSFSFIASVSDSFQKKNTKMSIDTTFQQLNNMMRILHDRSKRSTVKLYISCINECPIDGKIDNNIVIEKIMKFNELNPDILCLSDTCGSLIEDDLNNILCGLKNVLSVKDFKKISLHLHVKKGRENDVERIIHSSLDFGIANFDVSALDSGGCSTTIYKGELAPNLSYELYYKSLVNYILKESEKIIINTLY